MLDARTIVSLQDAATTRWHDTTIASLSDDGPYTSFDMLILNQHRANFELWHHEDDARDLSASDHDITEHKHAIDTLNQRRNDLAEQIDQRLLGLVASQDTNAPLHSETPGMMIDRLSILSLKRFHTEEEARRPGAAPAHHQRNRERLDILDEQSNDLALCLEELWDDVLAGRRRFKLYRQMKMYNDPDLNPALYRRTVVESDDTKDI